MSAYEVLSKTNQWLVRFEGLKYDYALFRNDVEPAMLLGLGHAGFEYFHLFSNWLVRFQRVLTSILTFFVGCSKMKARIYARSPTRCRTDIFACSCLMMDGRGSWPTNSRKVPNGYASV